MEDRQVFDIESPVNDNQAPTTDSQGPISPKLQQLMRFHKSLSLERLAAGATSLPELRRIGLSQHEITELLQLVEEHGESSPLFKLRVGRIGVQRTHGAGRMNSQPRVLEDRARPSPKIVHGQTKIERNMQCAAPLSTLSAADTPRRPSTPNTPSETPSSAGTPRQPSAPNTSSSTPRQPSALNTPPSTPRQPSEPNTPSSTPRRTSAPHTPLAHSPSLSSRLEPSPRLSPTAASLKSSSRSGTTCGRAALIPHDQCSTATPVDSAPQLVARMTALGDTV